MIIRFSLVSLALVALPAVGHAATVVLTPMLTDATVNPEDRSGVYQVISSELDFSPEIDRVVELTEVPRGLDDWCLTNARCLQAIAVANNADGLVAGRLGVSGSSFVMDVVYFQGERIVRRMSITVPQDPTALANSMNPVVRELLTGVDPRQVAESAPSIDEFEVDDDAPLDPELNLDGIDVAATGGARPADEDDILAFDFGSASKDDISVSELAEERQRATTSAASAARGAAGASEAAVAPPVRRSPEPQGRAERAPRRTASAPVRPARSSTTIDRSSSSTTDRAQARIAARGGWSHYYKFDFVTGGVEAGLHLGGGVQLLAGVEVYAVNRVLPPDVQLEEGVYSEWNLIFPLNAGLVYQFDLGVLKPYIGVDAIVTQYYRDDLGGDWAGGARGRLGIDYMVVENFGLNVNLAAGAWTGKNWGLIEQGVGQTGFLPQVSAGTVLAF